MKVIQPKQIWDNGVTSTAVFIKMWSFYDNLVNTGFADFRYDLLDSAQNVVYSNQLKMSGSDYDNWTDNDYAYEWAATELGLVLVGDYSTTTTSTTSSTTTMQVFTSTTTSTTTKP
jgi:hypothetical protein